MSDSNTAPNKEDLGDEDSGLTASLGFLLNHVRQSRNSILVCSLAFILLATVYVAFANKQYVASGSISQTDITSVVPLPNNVNLSLSALTNSNQNARLNDYLMLITSPEIDAQLMQRDDFIQILFGKSWIRSTGPSHEWVHAPTLGRAVLHGICWVLQTNCPDQLTGQSISQALSNHLSIEPSASPDQGILSPIGASSSYDISLTGTNPASLVKMMKFIHDATNHTIQQREIVFSESIVASLSKRIAQIDNNDARGQLINTLSDMERKLAVLRAGRIDYAAQWTINPSLSTWPTKPNLMAIYLAAIAAGVIVGSLLRLLPFRVFSARIKSKSNLDRQKFSPRIT